jgi:hypothetical protein
MQYQASLFHVRRGKKVMSKLAGGQEYGIPLRDTWPVLKALQQVVVRLNQ